MIEQILAEEMERNSPPLLSFGELKWLDGHEKGIQKGREEGIEKGIEKGREEGIEKGREEGIEKGQRQTHINNIKQTLAIRFGGEVAQYDEPLTRLSVPQLEGLSRTALLVTQVAEFEQQLREVLEAGS